MRKLFLIVAVSFLSLGVVSANSNRPISVDNLPQKAQQFIKKYFSQVSVTYATEDRDILSKEYEVMFAEGTKVDALILRLYNETGLLALASKSGGKENLTLLYDYARSYEAGSFKGLYNFISFINNIIDKKTTFDDTRARSGVDAVKIVTFKRKRRDEKG